jgi:nitrate/nitrite transport system substrate-binding protein
MKEQGMSTPDTGYKKFKVMGKEFDANKAEEYVNGFAIKKRA